MLRRDALLEDSFAALGGGGSSLKGPLGVSFINSVGAEEAGLDQGGLMKEFLEEVSLRCSQHLQVAPEALQQAAKFMSAVS